MLLVEPVLITVAAGTNPWHLWVYDGAGAAEMTGSTGWGYGPGFWWHTAGLAFADDLRRRCELNVVVVEGQMIA